jgi:hypothetical protein
VLLSPAAVQQQPEHRLRFLPGEHGQGLPSKRTRRRETLSPCSSRKRVQ